MKVLAVETSCDETSVAVVEENQILSNVVATQEEVHAPFGGVVPELASRRHLEMLPTLTQRALEKSSLSLSDIEGVAVTASPGLVGALLVGLSYAKALAFARGLPFVGVNHLEGHLNSVFLEEKNTPSITSTPSNSPLQRGRMAGELNAPQYPYCCLVVSGGHTSLYHVRSFGEYRRLGNTRDDAAGEVYDKAAKLLGLGYPGGPILDRLATQGNPKAFHFTIPNLGDKTSLEFSFSGFKTAVRLLVEKQKTISPTFQQDIAASFQEVVTSFLLNRIISAAQKCNTKTIAVVGGVASNQGLRKKLEALRAEEYSIHIPPLFLCTDNAAMIGYVGGQYLKRGVQSPWNLNATAVHELG